MHILKSDLIGLSFWLQQTEEGNTIVGDESQNQLEGFSSVIVKIEPAYLDSQVSFSRGVGAMPQLKHITGDLSQYPNDVHLFKNVITHCDDTELATMYFCLQISVSFPAALDQSQTKEVCKRVHLCDSSSQYHRQPHGFKLMNSSFHKLRSE